MDADPAHAGRHLVDQDTAVLMQMIQRWQLDCIFQ